MKKLILALAAAMLLFSSVGLFAQTPTTGQIAGTVVDPTGALVPGAKIVLTSDAGTQRTITSDASGHYTFPLLPPGRYSLEVTAAGFAVANFTGVTANITETTPLDISLKVKSAAGESINVSAAPPLVQSENATQGHVIQQETIRQLPLPTRNFQQLLTLTTGTSGSLQNSSELGRGDAVISVNGQRTTSNSVVINGMDAAAIGTGGTPNLAVPASDSLQEFIVQTSLYDASTGRSTGGVVAAVTKSGTNQWHGNIYEFLRNKSLNANNFFLKRQGTDRPDYKRNQFGGTLGGPIVKDKFFVFLSYQGTRETNGTSLTNSLSTVFVPGCLTNDRTTTHLMKQALPTSFGGCGLAYIPGYFDSVALKIFQAQLPNGQYLIPSPAVPTTNATPVAVTVPTISKFQEDQFNFNLDYKLTQNNTINGKFFWADNPTTQGLYSFAGVQNAIQAPGAATQVNLKNRVLSVGDMWVISPTMINDFRAGGNVITVDSIPDQPFTSAQWGITNPLGFAGAPTISVTNGIDLNASPLASNFSQNKTYTFGDTLTWTKGKHTLKFGGEYKRQFINLRFDAYNNGQLFYLDYPTMVSGLPLLSILGTGDPYRDIRANDFNLFVQDDWHVSKRLTVNAGLRWDVYGAFTEEKGRFVAFDPRLAQTTSLATAPVPYPLGVAVTAGFVQAGNGSVPGIPKVQNGLVDTPYTNFGPRIGFAFRPNADNDTVVIRGGYGIYYDRINARSFNSQVFNPPYDLVGLNLSNFSTHLIKTTDPYVHVPAPGTFPIAFNNTTYFPDGGAPFFLPVPSLTGTVVSPVPVNGIYPDRSNFVTPYVQQYNLGVQWEAMKNTLLDISYVGSMSHKLTRLVNLNQSTLPTNVYLGPYSGTYPVGLSGLASAPLGTFVQQTSAQSAYNSLQASVTKRYSNGLQLLASYTWSHSIDDFSGGAVNDLTGVIGDTHQNYFGSSDFDRRHRFVVSFVYDLPRAYRGGAGFPKQVLNNWQLAGVGTWQSGTPFSIIGNASAFVAVYADFKPGETVGSATKSGDVISRLNSYFNTASFRQPTGAGWGNVPRNAFVGPGQKNLDLSIVKFFPIREKQKLEFRSEFFNLFNHTNFANPVNILASAQFGQILSTSTGPRVIQFALKYSF